MFSKTIILGNLTRDIELRYTQSGMAIAKTGIASSRKFKKQNGEQSEETLFIDIVFFGKSAEIANQYLRKGSKVLIEGRLTLEQWTDQNGQKRSKHSVTVEEMKMLDSRSDAQRNNQPPANQNYQPPQQQQNGTYGNQGYQQPRQQPQQPRNQQPQQPQVTHEQIPANEEIPF